MDKAQFQFLEKAYGDLPCDVNDLWGEDDDEGNLAELSNDYESAYETIQRVYLKAAEVGGFKAKYG